MAEETLTKPFVSEAELDELFLQFEEARIPNECFTHREHLAVAALYALQQRGLAEIRTGIQRLNDANGVVQTPERGYHETITRAWMILVGGYLLDAIAARLSLVNDVLDTFGDKKYLLRFYSRDLLMSWEARTGWVEPDLEQLPNPWERQIGT